MAARRADWRESQPGLDGRRLIFIDETWAKTNMTRLRGRAPRGQRRHACRRRQLLPSLRLLATRGLRLL